MFKARTSKAGRSGKGNKGTRGGGRLGGPVGLAGPVMMVLCVSALPAMAGPRGERVVRGEATFQRQGRNTTITAGNNAIIEYDRFNIRRRETVEFVQPTSSARVLNRITGPDPTSIRGTLRSNGVVYIVNPAGVIFAPTATVDVGGIYAAAGGLSNRDFVSGNDHFTNVSGRVVNQGSIRAESAVGLIGRRVANFGTVVAPEGTVTMVAGDEVWIGERGGYVFARFSTDAGSEAAGGVTNAGSVVANQMLAGVGDYYALAVFDSSYIRARSVALSGGVGTTTSVAGTIDVSDRSAGGVGGSVTVTGERVALRGTQIDASGDAGGGSVRIGGDYQGGRNGGVDGQAAIRNAERTYVAPGTTINADAVSTGDGGRVIVWSDVFTNYNGSITARGGAQGGDGGFAEVSGKDTLVFNGTANLSATDGAQGNLLLDPRDITIANGGAAVVASNNEFGENAASDVSFDADLITAITDTGTAVTLQANRDITINEAITTNNAGGAGGDITLQAGRSILINANITTDDGAFSATANETAANGVVNANRDAGAAVITMADGVAINAGAGNVTMTVSTGAGLTNSTSGNMTIEDITSTGTVTLTNNGPTAGSSIVVEATGPDSLVTAGNLALVVGGAGGAGSIGTGADPIAFTATNVEASGQSGGVFLDTTSTTNVGGASGSITGISTSATGAIELTTGAGNLTTSEAITGTGTVDLTGTAINLGANVTGNGDTVLTGPVTITGSRTVSAGTGRLDFVNTVTLSTAGAQVTLVGTAAGAGMPGITFGGNVTPDAGGSTLVFEPAAASTDFSIASGGTDELIDAASIGFLQNGFDELIFGRSDGQHDISISAITFQDPVVFQTPTSGDITVAGTITTATNGTVSFSVGGSNRIILDVTGNAVVTTGEEINFGGAVRVAEGESPVIDSANGPIRFGGAVDGTAGGGAETLVLDAGAGNIDFQTVASAVSGAGGAASATGLTTLTITDANNLSIQSILISGALTSTNPLVGATTALGTVSAGTITLNAASFDFDAAVTAGAGGINLTTAGLINFDSTLTAGAGGVTTMGAAHVFDALISTSGGGDVTLNGAAITLTGGITTAGANANVGITNSGLLTISSAVTANGTFTQTNGGGAVSLGANVNTSGADGTIQFNSAVTATTGVTLNAGAGAIDLNSTFAAGANNVIFTTNDFQPSGANTVTGTGTLTLRPENISDSIDLGSASTAATATYDLTDFAALANGFSTIHIGYVTTGTHTINADGFNGGAALRDDLEIHAPAGAGQITLLGSTDTGGNDLVFDGVFNAGATLTIDTGATGQLTFSDDAAFGANDVALVGDLFADFAGALTGSGTLIIQPTTNGTAIDIGDVVGAGGALQGGLVISEAALQTLNDADFAAIEIGIATTGTHSIQVGDTTGATAWNSDVVLHAPAGAGLVTLLADQLVDITGNANAAGALTFDAPVNIASNLTIFVEGTTAFTATFSDELDLAGNDLTLCASTLGTTEFAFDGGAGTVVSSPSGGVLTFCTASDDTPIDIGTITTPQANALTIDATSVQALDNSLDSVVFGNEMTGRHNIQIEGLSGGSSIPVSATFHSPASPNPLTRRIIVVDDLDADPGVNLTFDGPAWIGLGTAGPANAIAITLQPDMMMVGGNIDFNQSLRISNETLATITTNDGNATFDNDVFGSSGNTNETLTVDAGAGDVTFATFIAGLSTGLSSSTGLTDVTIIGDNVDLGFESALSTVASVDITGRLTIDNAGTLNIDDDIFADEGVTITDSTMSGNQTSVLSRDVFITASSATGEVRVEANAAIDTNGFDLTISSRDIDILGSIGGGDGTNILTLRPDLATGAIDLGTLTANTAGALVLDSTDLGNILDGFGGIEIGFATTGSHSFLIGNAAFTDPLTLHASAAGGGFQIAANRTLSGTGNASIDFLGSHSTLVMNNGSSITTAGMDINIDDNVRLADGAGNTNTNVNIPFIDTGTGGGNITIDGSVFGTDNASGMVERLRLRSGTGTITIADAINVNGTTANVTGVAAGTASTQGLIDFRIVSAAGVTLQRVNIAGALSTESALTGGFLANDEVLTQSISMSGTTFLFMDGFEATNNGGGTAAFTNSGAVTTTTGEASANITTTGSMNADRLDADGSITIGGNLDLSDEAHAGGNISVTGTSEIGDRLVAGGNITLTGDAEFDTGAPSTAGLRAGGTIAIGGDLDTNGEDITLRAREINFNGGANSVFGGGTLTIRHELSSGDMRFGFASDAGASTLDLTDTDLAALASGFDSVVFGLMGGTHDMTIDSAIFRNATVFNYQMGTMLIRNSVTATLAGATLNFLGGDSGGTTIGDAMSPVGGVTITSNNGADIRFDDNVTLGADTTISLNGGTGLVEIDGTVDGGFDLTILGGDGQVEIDGAVGAGAALASLVVSGDQITLFNGIGTSTDAGVTGLTSLQATSILTLGGEDYHTNMALYQTGGTGNILGIGSGSTATFNSSGSSITFDGAGTGEFDIDDGVNFTVDSGGGDINLAADFSGTAGAILFDGPVVLTGDTSIVNQGVGSTSTITFAGTVDGGFELEVATAGGSIFFQGDIGSQTALAALDVNSAADVELENIGLGREVGVDGDASITAAGDIVYNGTGYAAGGSGSTFSLDAGGEHSLMAGAETTFATDGGDLEFSGGDIHLSNSTDLAVVTAGGDGTFTDIRGTSDENVSINLGAGTGTFALIGTGDEIDDIAITANDLNLTGDLTGNTLLIRGGTSGRSVIIAGNGMDPGLLLSRQEFARITDGFTSVTIESGGTSGAIIVGGDGLGVLEFLDPLTLRSDGSNVGSIVIREDLSAGGTVGGNTTLTLDAGSILLGPDASDDGDPTLVIDMTGGGTGAGIIFEGATFLGADASIITDNANVLFRVHQDGALMGGGGTIDNINNGGPFGLTVDAGTGNITVDGDIGLNRSPSDLGLGFVDFTGSTISIKSVATDSDGTHSGDQTYTGNTVVGSEDEAEARTITSNGGSVLFDGAAALLDDTTITADDVTFSGVLNGGDSVLVVNADGTAEFGGNATNLRRLDVTGDIIRVGNVTTTRRQFYQAADHMELGGTLRSTTAGDITITGDLLLVADSAINISGDSNRRGNILIDGDVTSDPTAPAPSMSRDTFNLTLTGAMGGIEITGNAGGAPGDDDNVRIDNLVISGPSSTTLQGVRVSSALDIQTLNATLNGPVDSDGRLVISVNDTAAINGAVNVARTATLNGLNIRIGDGAGDDTFTVGPIVDPDNPSVTLTPADDAILLVGPAEATAENRVANVTVNAPIVVRGRNDTDLAAMTFNVNRLILNNTLEVTRGDILVNNAGRFEMGTPDSNLILNGNNFDQVGEGRVILGFQDSDPQTPREDQPVLTIEAVRSSRIAFDGPVRLAGDVSIRAGRLEFNGGIDNTGALPRFLTLTSARQTVITDDIGSISPIGTFTTAGRGNTILSADISTAGAMFFGQAILLNGNSTIDSSAGGDDGSIVFASTIDEAEPDPTDPSSNLTVLTAVSRVVDDVEVGNYDPTLATITLRAPVGATRPIDSLSLNTATNRSSFGARNVTIRDASTNNVLGVVNGATAALVPTIIIDPDELTALGGFTAIGPNNPMGALIRTNNGVRTGEGEKIAATFPNSGGTFNRGFNTTDAPTLAIVVEGDGDIRLPDVVVDGNLLLDVQGNGNIAFLQRAGGPLLTAPPERLNGESDAALLARYFAAVNDPANRDTGTDLFANGFFYFSEAATIIRDNTERAVMDLGSPFIAAQGNANGLGPFVVLNAADAFDPASLRTTPDQAQLFWGFSLSRASAFSGLVDILADGNAINSAAVQQQAPPESQSGTVAEATAIGTSAEELLRDAGIETRDPEDFLDALLGRALYNDLPTVGAGNLAATVNRFSRDIAVNLARDFTAFFKPAVLDENGRPVLDEDGQPMVRDRRAEVRDRLNAALLAYRRQAGGQVDPASFREFIRTNPEYAEANADLDALSRILEQFRILGLSPREYLNARDITLGYVKPDRLTLTQFVQVVEAERGQGSTSDLVPLPEETETPAAEPAAAGEQNG